MIRPARTDDLSHILRCIRELARYEKLEHELELDEQRLHVHLFGEQPIVKALIAEDLDERVGFALFYTSYSTFKMRPCLYLEDLVVLPEHRGKGHGLRLLAAVAAEAETMGCARLTWNVLDWNEPAIRFYRSQGADLMPDWRSCHLTGEGLSKLAEFGRSGKGTTS